MDKMCCKAYDLAYNPILFHAASTDKEYIRTKHQLRKTRSTKSSYGIHLQIALLGIKDTSHHLSKLEHLLLSFI